jgi:hypothetical protein
VIVSAGIDVIEAFRFVKVLLGVDAVEDEALDLVCRVEFVAVFFVMGRRIIRENATDVGGEGRAVLIDDRSENERFTGTEDVLIPFVSVRYLRRCSCSLCIGTRFFRCSLASKLSSSSSAYGSMRKSRRSVISSFRSP